MPDPREIGRLKKVIRALANEDSVLEDRGEPYVDLPPPPAMKPLPPEAEEGFESGTIDAGIASAKAPTFAEIPDFSSLIAGIDLDAPPDSSLEALSEPSDKESAGEGGEPEPEALPGLEEDVLDAAGDFAPEVGAAEAQAPEAGDFDLGEFAASMMGDEGIEAAPGDAAAEEAFPPGEEPSPAEDFSSLADFALGGGEDSGETEDHGLAGIVDADAMKRPPPPPAPESGSDESPIEEFASFEDAFAETIPEAGTEEAAAVEDVSAIEEMPVVEDERPTEEMPPADEGPAAANPDLGGFDLGGEDQGGKFSRGEDDFDIQMPPIDHPFIASEPDALPEPEGRFAAGTGQAPESAAPDQPMPSPEPFGFEEPPAGGFEFTPRKDRREGPEGEEAEAFDDGSGVALTEKQVDKLQDSLLSYPLNLRLEIEKGIAEEILTDQQAAVIVKLLVDGASARETAVELGRMLGKRISVPKGFERRTGEDLEAETGSFWYAFRKNILPLIGAAAAAILGVAGLGFLGYQFVYKPIRADLIYREGYRAIVDEDYALSEKLFDKAYGVRRVKGWHYRYARSYAAQKQYFLTERKYEQILARYIHEKRAAMEYARLESEILLDYPKAEKILKGTILEWRPKDIDALLLHGDNYLAWADDLEPGAERDAHLESARKAYASLIRMRGKKDVYMGRMALYFIRADKLSEVLPIRDYLLSNKGAKIDSRVYAELGGYLVDRGRLDGVQVILMGGVKRDPALPENHYGLARFFRATGVRDEERKAIVKAIEAYDALPALTRKRVAARIDCLRWAGRWYFESGQFLESEGYYVKAVDAYENALGKRLVKPGARFGEIYAGLADIHYYDKGDLASAFSLYEKADRNGYETRDTDYKRGFIDYRRGDYANALGFLYDASLDSREEDNLLYAMANTLYRREDFAAAAGYYERVAERMQDEIDRFVFEDPQDRPQQRRIVLLLMTARNNLGVSLYRLSSRMGDASRRSSAMAELTESARLYDVMNRDQETMIRAKQANLAYLNLDGVLHPSKSFIPQIYPGIARDIVDTDERMAIDALLYSGGM